MARTIALRDLLPSSLAAEQLAMVASSWASSHRSQLDLRPTFARDSTEKCTIELDFGGRSGGIIESCSLFVVRVFAVQVAGGCAAIVSELEALLFVARRKGIVRC